MSGRLRYLFSAWTTLRKHPAFRQAPMRVLGRAALWSLHCAARRPATIALGSHGARLRLPPRFRRGGATGVFVLREHYEPELGYLEATLRPGMVVIDGGANLGIYTLLASALVGEEGVVLAFEPGETSYRSLQENIALNGARNVRAFKRALAEAGGTSRLYHTRGGLVGYSLTTDEGPATVYEDVQTTTIDEALAEARIDRVDLLKLDVEGSEELALRGAARLLDRARPTVLFEMAPFVPITAGMRHDGAWGLLERRGYRLFEVTDHGALIPRSAPRVGNNLAVPG